MAETLPSPETLPGAETRAEPETLEKAETLPPPGTGQETETLFPPETLEDDEEGEPETLPASEEYPDGTLGFGCKCGFHTLSHKELKGHLASRGAADGPGVHKSLGQIDMSTGEVITPPIREMSSEQRTEYMYQKHHGSDDASGKKNKKRDDGGAPKGNMPTITKSLSSAQQARFSARVITCDYTPIMRSAREAAVDLFQWPADMDLADFLDTVLWHFFHDRNVALASYSVIEQEVSSNAS